MKLMSAALVALNALVASAAIVLAQGPGSSSVAYQLGSGSEFETGCFGRCECAVVSTPVTGTFDLALDHSDPLFEVYRVSNVQWTLPQRGGTVITGSGTYRVGGEVAVQHELVLDLVVGGGALQHFDSGLVTGTNDFPKIAIDVSLHQQVCLDTVIAVRAAPAVAATDLTRGPWIVRAQPNPFQGATDLSFTLPERARVHVGIYDLAGRAVRVIERDRWLESGPHVLSWDGRRADGAECGAGFYVVRLTAGEHRSSRLVSKLR